MLSSIFISVFKKKKKKTYFGVFIQTSRGYLLKLLGEHAHSKAVSQRENILQLIKVLFVWDMEKSSKSYTTQLLFDSSIGGGGWIIFDSSIKRGKKIIYTLHC